MVRINVSGPVKKIEKMYEDKVGISNMDLVMEASGHRAIDDRTARDYIMLFFEDYGQYSFYSQVVGASETDEYYVTETEKWEATISGVDETRPIVMAADEAAQKGIFENSLQALISMSRDESFPFSRQAGWLAEEASGEQVMDNLSDWYDRS